jgi:predicted ATPase/DNA-binding SARP family transcriptional activator
MAVSGSPALLQISVLGPLAVTIGDKRVSVAGPRLQGVLGVLALRAGQTLSVQQLIDAGWAEDDVPATAVKTVRSHVAHLRQTLRRYDCESVLRPSPPGYRLELPAVAVDSGRFEAAAVTGRAHRDRGDHAAAATEFAKALSLWRGDLLAGCPLHSWAAAEATRLQEAKLAVTEDRLAAELAIGRHRGAIGELEYLVGMHPFRERLWELLMQALYADGRQADALAAYQRARRVLREELGVDPGRGLRELEATILRGDEQPAAAAQPAVVLATPPPPGGRVPSPVTALVGRQEETAAVVRLVGSHRLVTLSGFGGCGKTRVAIAACQELAGQRDPVVFVDLAAVTEPTLVAPSVAAAIGVPHHTHLPLAESVAQHYAGRRPLLVLDNCEHLVDECARLVDSLLVSCGQLHVLATSRQALRAAGEKVYPLSTLPVPAPDTVRGGADLVGYDGVELFAERAGIADLAGLPTGEARALATVCATVDGLPLALELAAARARVLSLAELAALLGDRLDVLSAGPRTARPQHRTLRACVQWSYELLDPPEQALLRALAVVAGTCDLPAVAALCPGEPASGVAALDQVDELVTRSLLVTERQPTGSRYRMLDTIRHFAAGLLADQPAEHEAALGRHAAHYLWLAENLDRRLRGSELEHVLDRMTADHDNMRAAMTWLVGDGTDPAAALRLARALWQYCYLRGHYREGRQWLASALAVAEAGPVEPELLPVLGAALDGAAALAHYECDYPEASDLGERALLLYRELGDPRGAAGALNRLGSVERERAEYHQSRQLHEDALELCERADDEWGVGNCMQLLGLASWLAGEPDVARGWATRGLRQLTGVGDKERIGWTLLDLGAISHYTGDDDAAAGHLDTARQLFAEIGFKEGLAWADNLLALVDVRRGDLPAALGRLGSALLTHHELGDRWRLASILEALADVASRLAAPTACADLLGMARAKRRAIGAPVPVCERPAVAHTEAWLLRVTGRPPTPWEGPMSLVVVSEHLADLRSRLGA